LLGPRAPGLTGSIEVLGRRLPTYDIFLIVVGPFRAVDAASGAAAKTRFGRWCARPRRTVRWWARSASTRPCCSRRVRARRFARWPWRRAADCRASRRRWRLDLITIGDAFVVVVVGGMGSISGAYLAAVIIAEVKACASASAS
jgi:hypothetical protein